MAPASGALRVAQVILAIWLTAIKDRIDIIDHPLLVLWFEHGRNPENLPPETRSQLESFTNKYNIVLSGEMASASAAEQGMEVQVTSSDFTSTLRQTNSLKRLQDAIHDGIACSCKDLMEALKAEVEMNSPD